MTENWFSSEKRNLLLTERYFSGSHHYFFEVKEAKNSSKYIIIDQRKKLQNEFISTKMRIFENEMLEFQRILNKLINFSLNDTPVTETDNNYHNNPIESNLSPKNLILLEEKYFSSSHYYFFEVKESKNGAKYIVIAQRKKLENEFISTKMRIFKDEMLEFQRVMNKLIAFTLNDNFITNKISDINKDNHNQQIQLNSDLLPRFFDKIITTNNWKEFEEYAYYLLKLLGIETVYNFGGERQAGKADGFFKIGNLAVIYDCTLDFQNIENSKSEQINNYCNKLKQGSIELSGRTTEEFYNHHKQVWIITRGTTRQIKLVNSIEVKEVAINDIMYLYQERLKSNMNNQSLEIKLRNI